MSRVIGKSQFVRSMVENDPADTSTIDEIFRVAHSLKGVSSTMGYDKMAELTHHLEHLLDLVRAKK